MESLPVEPPPPPPPPTPTPTPLSPRVQYLCSSTYKVNQVFKKRNGIAQCNKVMYYSILSFWTVLSLYALVFALYDRHGGLVVKASAS